MSVHHDRGRRRGAGLPATLLLALGALAGIAAGCESTPEKGDDAPPAGEAAASKVPPEPERDRSIGAPPFTPPKPKERPNDPVDAGGDEDG